MLNLLQKLDNALGAGLKWFNILCLVALAFVLSGVVFVRFVPIAKLSWSDEAVEWTFAWMVFMGSAALWRMNEHFCVDAVSCALQNKKGGLLHKLIVHVLCLAFFCIFIYYSFMLTISANDRSPILMWPRFLWYACMPISGVLMAGYSLKAIISIIIELFAPASLRRVIAESDREKTEESPVK